MPAKLKHLAIVSDQYTLLERFYEAMFGMKPSPDNPPAGAVVVSDGYVGLNINPRKGKAGRQAGLDHFGFEVEDVESVAAKLREKYPDVNILKRPGSREFAGITTHDPAGNVFDLSQPGMENRRDVYVEEERLQERHIKHIALRTVNAAAVAQFYRDVLELRELEKPANDPNAYFTDDRVVFMIMPWNIKDFLGTGVERPALDHIGFKVESLESFKKDVEVLSKADPEWLAPKSPNLEAEYNVVLGLLQACRYGEHQLPDPEGNLIDVAE
jgi:catechol 2,3-dioxygenase-like lactoylglutathione lyase family enzyme